MAKKDERFVVDYRQEGMLTETKILIDRKTGVNYLYYQSSNSGGLTPLLDREGRPIITTVFEGLA